jgi:hypothetical protein
MVRMTEYLRGGSLNNFARYRGHVSRIITKSEASAPSQFAATSVGVGSAQTSPLAATTLARIAALSEAVGVGNPIWKSNQPADNTIFKSSRHVYLSICFIHTLPICASRSQSRLFEQCHLSSYVL